MRTYRLALACLLAAACAPAACFHAAPAGAGVAHRLARPLAVAMAEPSEPREPRASPLVALRKIPLNSLFLGLITVQSGWALTYEVPELFTPGARPDLLGTLVDAGFLAWGVSTLAQRAGVGAKDPPPTTATPSGMACGVTLNIGREPGTWMPADWAASGARLSLPMTVRFSDEDADIDGGAEPALAGGRPKRLYCEGGSFVGAQGVVTVAAAGGAWSATSTGRPGESLVRFFVDFPRGASRNDVELPAGRVFFSTACWDGKLRAEADAKEAEVRAELDALQAELDAPGSGARDGELGRRRLERVRELMKEFEQLVGPRAEDVVEGPDGIQLLNNGGLTIKRNDWRNLYGAMGEVFLILGRFAVTPPKEA